jgi:ATP-dependent helicase/nuclease subunit B
MSASRLEQLGRCPYGYFLRYVLEISPPEELELDQSRWLSPMQRGSLLHEIYAGFMREMRRRGEAVRAIAHRTLIQKIAADLIARYREDIPPPSESIFVHEQGGICEALDVFLMAEEEWAGMCEPLLFEVTFGMGRKKRLEKGEKHAEAAERGMDEPAVLEIGGERPMAVAGRIDRIDRIGEGCYRVVDYKTGSYSLFEDLVDFGKGRILQHALYAIAGEQVLKKLKIDALPVVTESGYYFPTRKGEGNKIMREVKRRAFKDLVAEIITILENGHFVANPGLGDAECEDFCDYAPVCGGAAAKERAKRKKEQNQEVFGIFERLKDYD